MRELADRIRERPEDADGARRLLYEVVRNPTLERMLCAREPTLTPTELVQPGRVCLISGEAARVGEVTARYLLAVYLALLWSEVLAVEAPQKTFIVLDEAQWFAHESLGEMLRLSRRRNVHVVLATQTLASLPETVRESVWTNVADFVAFRGSPEEAREFSRAASGIPAGRLLSLNRGEAAVLLGKGRDVQWVRTVRIPSEERTERRPRFRAGVEWNGRGPVEHVGRISPEEGGRSSRNDPGPPGGSWTVNSLLDALRHRTHASPAGDLIPVVLHELRETYQVDLDLVRRLGTRLGRADAIVRTSRGPDGSVWWLDPARIPGPSGPSAELSERGSDSPPPQPS